MSINSPHLEAVFRQFETDAEARAFSAIRTGHIHETFQVQTGRTSAVYILQRVNQQVFPDVVQVMNNIETVTNHLKGRAATLCFSRTFDQQLFHTDEDGCHWRVCQYVDHEPVVEGHVNCQLALEAGSAFGEFFTSLHDLNPHLLAETIRGFHCLSWRLDKFGQALHSDVMNRAALLRKETEFINTLRDEMLGVEHLWKTGRIPQRITHNDTKITNVLFDKNLIAVCIIDLDTVMPGQVHFDFGDALRTIANTAAEDAADPGSVSLDHELTRAFTRGYLGACGALLTRRELETLWRGPGFMTFLMGLRFLTDYLAGDRYYKTRYPNHNLVRARTQFALLREMRRETSFLQETIFEAATAPDRKRQGSR